jgi:NTP pyrophosphatase (non-canonical NTP hydrolase)
MNLNEFQQASRTNGDNVLLNQYQADAVSTAIYPGTLSYPTLGLCGEVGELIAVLTSRFVPSYRDDILDDFKKEAGDVLWYVANVASDMDVLLSEVMQRKEFDICLEVWDVDEGIDELPVHAGVVAENVKKTLRDNCGVLTDDRCDNIMKALRLVVVWLERLCSYYGTTLAECAQLNSDKLRDRQERGVLKGDGDNR